jgi:hypothetical protein
MRRKKRDQRNFHVISLFFSVLSPLSLSVLSVVNDFQPTLVEGI